MEQIYPIIQLLSEYREEIAGILLIICLLLLTVQIRKKRRKASKKDMEQLPTLLDAEDSFIENSVEAIDEAVEGEVEVEKEFQVEEEPEIEEKFEVKEKFDAEKVKVEKQAEPAISFFDRLKTGLSKTRQSFSKKFDGILAGNRKIDDEVLEQIEETLITSDVGVATTTELIQRISQKASDIKTAEDFKSHLKAEMLSFVDFDQSIKITAKPHVMMIVGVNGVGKTTTIGKLAAKYISQGKKVLLSASDTFRAAAVEQLQIWADRSGADIVKHRDNADPAAVAFDSIEAAVARDVDIVLVDTAGRLQTKINLMEQLKKIKRSISKKMPDAPHEVLLVLDATTGQNAVSQAKLFHEGIGITGIILAKLDGTAKGGIVLSICHTLKIPIRYIGIGESIDDLQEFDPKLFIDALI